MRIIARILVVGSQRVNSLKYSPFLKISFNLYALRLARLTKIETFKTIKSINNLNNLLHTIFIDTYLESYPRFLKGF